MGEPPRLHFASLADPPRVSSFAAAYNSLPECARKELKSVVVIPPPRKAVKPVPCARPSCRRAVPPDSNSGGYCSHECMSQHAEEQLFGIAPAAAPVAEPKPAAPKPQPRPAAKSTAAAASSSKGRLAPRDSNRERALGMLRETLAGCAKRTPADLDPPAPAVLPPLADAIERELFQLHREVQKSVEVVGVFSVVFKLCCFDTGQRRVPRAAADDPPEPRQPEKLLAVCQVRLGWLAALRLERAS